MNSEYIPTVSVVIVVRNEVKYIARTVESALGQDYPSIDIHVQDGASTDGTVDVLKRYPIKWISEVDRGQDDARNRGYHATKGEVVIFLPGDDILKPGAIRILVNALKDNPGVGFVYGDIEVIDASDKVYAIQRGEEFNLDRIFWRNIVPTQSVAALRTALEQVGVHREGILCADWDLWIRLGAKCRSVYIPKVIAQYRSHDGSSSLNQASYMYKSICSVADTLLADTAITSRLRYGASRAYAGCYLTAALVAVLAREMSTAWDLYFKAIRRYPRALLKWRGMSALAGLLMGPTLFWRVRNRGRGKG